MIVQAQQENKRGEFSVIEQTEFKKETFHQWLDTVVKKYPLQEGYVWAVHTEKSPQFRMMKDERPDPL